MSHPSNEANHTETTDQADTPVRGLSKNALFNKLIRAARAHGQGSILDHEVGDLQDAVYNLIELLDEQQLAKAAAVFEAEQHGFSEVNDE